VAVLLAGAVAAVVQAVLSSATEPVINRVLIKRMTVSEAFRDHLKDANLLQFFGASLSSNLLKKPTFELTVMIAGLLPLGTVATRGFFVALLFTTATLPVTNLKFWMSLQMPVSEAMRLNMLYKAYAPTLARDVAYATARGLAMQALLASDGQSDIVVIFLSVLLGCFLASPFNEWRGYCLQDEVALSAWDFFKPVDVLRSSSLGAFNQALSLAAGYWLSTVVLGFGGPAAALAPSGR